MKPSRLLPLPLLLLPWPVPAADAAQTFANIPCASIQGNFVTVGRTKILVNSPGPGIEFSIPNSQAYAPPEDIGGSMKIDVPITITAPIPTGATYTFTHEVTNIPFWLNLVPSPGQVVSAGTSSVLHQIEFTKFGRARDASPMTMLLRGVRDLPDWPTIFDAGVASFGPLPSGSGARTFVLNETANNYFLEIYLGAWEDGAFFTHGSRWSVRTNFTGYTGSAFTSYEVVPDPNPYFDGHWTRRIPGNFSNGDTGTFSLKADAPLAENAEVGADIRLKVDNCS